MGAVAEWHIIYSVIGTVILSILLSETRMYYLVGAVRCPLPAARSDIPRIPETPTIQRHTLTPFPNHGPRLIMAFSASPHHGPIAYHVSQRRNVDARFASSPFKD